MLNVRDLIPWSRDRQVMPKRHGFEYPFLGLQRDIDRLFHEFWHGFDMPLPHHWEQGVAMMPSIDVREDEKEVVICAELPGMTEEDIDVTLSDTMLVIEGEKKSEHEDREGGYRYTERSFGSFRRGVPIDAAIVGDKVEATFKDGVLTVVLPKTPEAQKKHKKIDVKGSGTAKKAAEKAKEEATKKAA